MNLQPITRDTPRTGRLLLARVNDTDKRPTLPVFAWVKVGAWRKNEWGVEGWREDAMGVVGPKDGPRLDPTHWALLEEIEVAA